MGEENDDVRTHGNFGDCRETTVPETDHGTGRGGRGLETLEGEI